MVYAIVKDQNGGDERMRKEKLSQRDKAWLGIRYCFKMPQTQKTRAHNGSELPSSRLASLACYAVASRFATVLAIICRPTLRRFAPSLRAHNFLFLRYPGVRGSRLRCCAAPPRQVAAPPPGYSMAPLRGSEFRSPTARNLFFNFRFIA